MPLSDVIARVRRAMPRNPDVMAICDALESSVTEGKQVALPDVRSVTCNECERRRKQTAERVARHRGRKAVPPEGVKLGPIL